MLKKAIIYLLFFLIVSGCTTSPTEQFIQGTWQAAQVNTSNRFLQWSFDNGDFSREQEIDSSNLLYSTGRYRILQIDGSLLTLELYDFAGDRISYENNPMAIQIEINRDDDTVEITNVLFVRVGP